jgi:hypothetical protein
MTIFIVIVFCVALGLGLAVWHVKSLFKGPNYSRLPAHYPFKTKAAEQRYHSYNDERSKEWPALSEARRVETSFGKTFVRVCGREDAPPLVLLPSGFASSVIWLPNIQGLAPHFRIYAVDNIHDVG